MIKTTKMAEAMMPQSRKRTKVKKSKTASHDEKVSISNKTEDDVSEVKIPVKHVDECSGEGDVTTDGATEKDRLCKNEEEENVGANLISQPVITESSSEVNAIEDTNLEVKGDQAIERAHCDLISESKCDAHSEAVSIQENTSHEKYEEASRVDTKDIGEDAAAKRPQTLPSFKSLADSLKEVSVSESTSVEVEAEKSEHLAGSATKNVSLASYIQQRHSSSTEYQNQPQGMISSASASLLPTFPAVVEDPDTPMARATSPGVTKVIKNEIKTPSPTIPTIIQEEKSPTLLAQEALARSQAMYVDTTSTSTKASAPVSPVTALQADTNLRDQQSVLGNLSHSDKLATLTSEKSTTETPAISSQPRERAQERYNREQTLAKTRISYPSLHEEQSKVKTKAKIGPMTLSELLALYYNPQLAYNDTFIEEFVQRENKKENHEFAEILSSYMRARHQFLSVEEDIKTLQKSYGELQKEHWITHVKSVTVQSQCADQAKVSATHQYEQCQLNTDALSQTNTTLEKIRTQISENLSLFAYSAQISRLQVESYIHDLYMSCPALRDIPKNAGVQDRQYVLPDESHQIQRLKDCITILFMFHRKVTTDREFITNLRQWTIRLVSSLLRLATYADHLFILNHILRCPAGVGKWATELIQCPAIPAHTVQVQSSFGSPALDHIVTAIATVLLPVKAREEFMCHMRTSLTEQSLQEERAWILVDSDGEEDEDPANAWLYLHENDIVAILSQFPLADVFSHILLATLSDAGNVDYDIRRSTEPMMIRLFAFTTVLIQLFGAGLTTYNQARYRQLNKRLGRHIRQTVSFVSDHWLNFKTYYGPLAPTASIESLQMEFDQLFMRATYSILTAQKLGSWQFMADMPYTCVSMDSMWQLLWILHQGHGQVVNVDQLPPVETCKEYMENPDSWQQLADNLMHMPTSEAIYLLTTFANMAGCRSSEEADFIQTITLEVFEIAYICNHTREFCSKVGRELLSSIIQTHPTALSFLLARVKDVMSKLGKMALYLFSELPVSIWQPTDPDMLTLRQWLLNHDLNSAENQLARSVLGKINWDVFEQSGKLVVDIRLHRQMALLLVEAYTKYISDKKAGFFIMEGMKQMASYMTSTQSAEQVFNNWVWDLALRLKLHQQTVLLHSFGAVDVNFEPPTLATDTWLVPLLRGTTTKTPIACFVAITMTNIGHDITNFIAEGLDLLSVLTSSYQYTTAIHVLGCVVPLFISCQQYLHENVTFCQILQSLLTADDSLLKSTKSTIMTVEFPGIVTQQLTEMIQAQVTSHLTMGKADEVIIFWLKAIFKVCKFFTDRNSCYVADTLIRWSLVKKGVMDIVSGIFKENYLKFCVAAKTRQGFVTSVFQWIAQSNTLPSYMDSASLPEFPWLAYMILVVEGEQEVNSRLWQTLIMELHSSSRPNIETALRTTVTKLQLEQAPSAGRLNIYRWAQQALDTPHDHPLLPVLWQRFFALYLGRQVFESSIAQRASVGEKFFESMYYSSMLKRMRKRLSETSTFHINFDPQKTDQAKRRRSSHSPGTPPGQDFEGAAAGSWEEDNLEYSSSKEFHQMLARLYQTYSLWLEEPRLHDGNLYLPALPPQYEAARLNQVFQGFMGPWLEFVDLEGVQYTLSCLAADWKKRLTCAKTAQATARRGTQIEPENATERIQRRLRRYETPKNPPAIQNIQSAVPLITSTIVDDREALMHLVLADLEVLTHFTKIFSARLAHHCALDNAYVELVPKLWSNVTKTITVTAECKSKVNPLHKCSGPALIPVKLEVKEKDEMTQRRVDENRVEYKQVMIESLLPTAPNICIAAVHTENAITLLIKQSQKSTDDARVRRLKDTACHLFFHMAGLVSHETEFYPPTKQFFASCIEILGQEFVCREAHQTSQVLQCCLDKPSVAGLVSPHFVPNNCPADLVSMYGQLLHVLQSQNLDLVFMLLTKFDIRQWLQSHSPSDAERKRFVETLGSAMMACGPEPTAESKLVSGLYVAHLAAVLESNFPSNLYSIVNMILQGSAAERLHTKIWETLLRVCFINRTSSHQGEGSRERTNTIFDCADIEACSDCRLSTVQVKELLDWLSSFFMHTRMADQEVMTFGLYSKWGRYVPYVSMMIGALARSFITKIINGSDEMSPYQIMELLWQPIVTVYSPWLQPLVNTDGSLVAPWVEADDVLAVEMVSSFCKAVLNVYKQMSPKHPANASGIFSLLLMYYMTGLSTKTTPSHVTTVYLSVMKEMPWRELRPDMQLLEAMIKVKEVSSTCCFTLIGHIMPQIQWPNVIGYFKSQYSPEVTSQLLAMLGVLLIQAYVDPECGKDDEICRLLSEAQKYDWSPLTQDGFSCACSWFLQLCDPKCVLAERSSKLALGLRLLRQMSGFSAEVQWNESLSQKRLTYIHCITQQLCQLTYAKGIKEESMRTVIVNLLSEIEAVESSIPLVEEQDQESLNLLKDLLSLFNNSNPEGPWLEMIMSTVTDWLRSSPQSLVLIPCMKASSRCLASLRQMSAVMEVIIEVYFAGMDHSSDGLKGWPFILSVFQVPELNQAGYVQDSLAESAYLVLYAYLQHKLPFCQGLADELVIMEEILDWTVKAQASAEDEAKLILWWHLLLRLAIRQVQLCAPSLTGSINILSRFSNHLTQIGQERTGRGLLGAIGFGRKSPLSNKMRLLARALSAYITTQLLSADSLRTTPAQKLNSSSTINDLRTLRKAKPYAQHAQTIDQAVAFIQSQGHTIHDSLVFIAQVARDLYGEKQYLCDVVKQGGQQ